MRHLAPVAPLLLAMPAAVAATALHRRVRPRLASALLTVAIVGVVLAVVPTMVLLAVGFLVHLPFGGGVEWCQALLGLHAPSDPVLGAIATGVLAVGVVRAARSVSAWRRHRCAVAGAPAVVDSDAWFAYSLPGPGLRLAVSSGLIDALDGDELEVVLAHERGHARHRHDRYLLVAELAACLVPPVEWLRRRLRFALERWADEVAVEQAGGDRNRVATTLAKVALGASPVSGTVAALNGLGVAARVEALLRPRQLRHERYVTSVIGVGLVAMLVAVLVQAHHAAELVATIC